MKLDETNSSSEDDIVPVINRILSIESDQSSDDDGDSEWGAKPYMFEPELGEGETRTSVNSINIPQARTTNLDWCKCGNCECKVSDTISTYNELVENKDNHIKCIIDHPGFEGGILNPWALKLLTLHIGNSMAVTTVTSTNKSVIFIEY